MDLEQEIFDNQLISIRSSRKIEFKEEPVLYWIRNLRHCIIAFPNWKIFNCNPRDYPLPLFELMVDGLDEIQVEPSPEEYQRYWKWGKLNEFEIDQNCILWSAYYLWWWKNRPTSQFPSSLLDLERWVHDETFKLSKNDR